MNFAELIRQRYSVRAYKPAPVPDDLLAQVLEAGRLAPTAANKQPFRVIVIHTKGREAELRRIYHRDWFTQAPLILCVCTVRAEAWKRAMYDGKSHADVDAAIVMDHMVLAAADLGLGTCWIAAFDPAAAARCWGCRRRLSRCFSRHWATRPTGSARRSVGRWPNWCATSGGKANGLSPVQISRKHDIFLAGQPILDTLRDDIKVLRFVNEVQVIRLDGQHWAQVEGA